MISMDVDRICMICAVKTIFITGLIWFFTCPCYSQFDYVLGIDGTDWHNPTHWVPDGTPSSTDSVLVTASGGIIAADSVARVGHVTITEFVTLTLENDAVDDKPGILIIDGSSAKSIVNEGILNNQGSIEISESAESAILNNGVINISSKGLIEVDSVSSGSGIDNFAQIFNEGTIDIQRTNGDGIYNSDSLINESNGRIRVRTTYGSDGTGVSNINGTWINRGRVNLRDLSEHGISGFKSNLYNYDTISVTDVLKSAVEWEDTLFNYSPGHIEILRVTDPIQFGLYFSDGEGAIFANRSTVEISNISASALYSFARIDNSGHIWIDSSGTDGLTILDTLFNQSDGDIEITDSGNTGIINQLNGVILNEGNIKTIDSDWAGIINYGIVKNTDTLYVEQAVSAGLINYNLFDNESDAFLSILDIESASHLSGAYRYRATNHKVMPASIESDAEYGILNYSNNSEADFNNFGLITIEECPTGIRNIGQFTNSDSLQISFISDVGISNTPSQEMVDVDFINNGFIDIVAGSGILIRFDTEFKIETSALVRITADDDEPLIVELGGILDCFGELDISAGMNNVGEGQ